MIAASGCEPVIWVVDESWLMADHKPQIDIEIPGIGPIIIDGESIRKVYQHVMENSDLHTDPMFNQISEWIAPDPDQHLESKQRNFSDRSYLIWAHSMMSVLEDRYRIDRVESYSGHGGSRSTPVYLHESFGNQDLRVPHRLIMFLQATDRNSDERIAVSFYPYDKWDVEVRFHYCHQRTDFNRLWTEIEHHFDRHGLLKNAKFDGGFNELNIVDSDWDSVIIGDGKKGLIQRNIIGFLGHLDRFKGGSLRTSRGVLLVGPPGTGKTLTCRVVISQVPCTVIYVTRDHITRVGAIDDIYKLARRLAPSLVVFEDIDTLGGADRMDYDTPSLGEFLNCLSGVETNDGVVTLATTNYPQKLDWALTDRPGRFDMRLDIDYPDHEQRLEILRRYLTSLPVSVKSLDSIADRIAKRTEGYTGAYLQELVQSAYMAGLEHHDYETDGWTLTWNDFDESLTVVDRMRSSTGRVIEPRIVDDDIEDVTDALYG